jgi:hypothetical protein
VQPLVVNLPERGLPATRARSSANLRKIQFFSRDSKDPQLEEVAPLRNWARGQSAASINCRFNYTKGTCDDIDGTLSRKPNQSEPA